VGEGNVCDYLDFVVAPDTAYVFYDLLLDHLKRAGISRLELQPLRPDSSVFTDLIPVAERRGCEISFESSEQSFELDLPGSWDTYLSVLSSKERHEIRRKFRRLHESGPVNYRTVDDVSTVQTEMLTFLTLFKSNRPDKSAFMTDQMDAFFQDLALEMARDRIVKLSFLEIDGNPIAAVMCFDYQSTVYLYNNGYDRRYRSLSAGLLCKLLSIKESIQSGKKTYDLLKGSEPYKHRLGGKPIPLYRCDIEI
jgi:CelD/BcsL family acetyltransferase involved in cellulose biosynthesis